MALALGAATALAQPAANPSSPVDRASGGTPLRAYDQFRVTAVNAAYVSDECDLSQLRAHEKLLTEPGYSIGTGAAVLCHPPASLSNGSDSSDLWNQQELLREPGYSVDSSAAGIGRA